MFADEGFNVFFAVSFNQAKEHIKSIYCISLFQSQVSKLPLNVGDLNFVVHVKGSHEFDKGSSDSRRDHNVNGMIDISRLSPEIIDVTSLIVELRQDVKRGLVLGSYLVYLVTEKFK